MIMHNSKTEMRTESMDITDKHQNIVLRSDPSYNELELHDALETSSDIAEEHIVGRREEKEKVMASLLEAMSKKTVILPIHGIGGIGKTTFARLIYNDPKFKCYSRVWVDVSQRFELNRIHESIISQLSRKESPANERQMIHYCLKEPISHKKVMIVLDDLWEEIQFPLENLKAMLNHMDSNIIVLVTTRSELVAKRICTNLQPHKILPLTNDMCWDIIKQRSGFKDRNDKEQLMGIGLEIAQKCGGVALAARSLGFTLRSQNFEEWMKVKDSHIWNKHVSDDFSLSNQVLASLKLSYSYMCPCLKLCFTYCATFPKGHKIVKDDLIYEWIALDFIKPTILLSDMQLCEKYIVQLLGLSFFQQLVSPKTSEVYYEQAAFFTMHDLVHDLAISILGNQILYQSEQGNTRGSSCQYALLRDCSSPLELSLTSRARLIALRFLDGCRSELSGAAFAPARSLRVLDLSECFIQVLPNSIGQLRQLRYLNAPKIQDEFVPECITKLSNLIYLNLQGSNISALPESIGELETLMHLDLSNCQEIHELPFSFRNLEKLVHLDLSNCIYVTGVSESLRSLSRLEHLNLSCCGEHEDLTGAMSGLTGLQYLNLSCVSCVGLQALLTEPEYLNSSYVSCVGLQQVLVNLTKLRYLNLERSLEDEEVGADEAEIRSLLECVSSLSNLEYLNLAWSHNLRTIPESIGNLTKLNTLVFSYCGIQRLPTSISTIISLKFLDVSGCSELDKSTLPQNKNITIVLLPYFVVPAGDGESNSNHLELEHKHLTLLDTTRLEAVKSIEEAKKIKLAEKKSIDKLEFKWTRDAKRFADDREVLSELVPPDTLESLKLKGYNSISFPSWMMSIATYLPRLTYVDLRDLPSCNVLPPLGQLPNLAILNIVGMDNIKKIDGSFYGGERAFPRLGFFHLSNMKLLEEWNASYSSVAFPELCEFNINNCPLLRFKSCLPCPLPQTEVTSVASIESSDQVLLSSWENRGPVGASSSAAIAQLDVKCCEVPLHQWNLLRHVPCLKQLTIIDCSDLTCGSTDLLQCISSLEYLTVRDCKNGIVALPERLGDLTSLKEFKVQNCTGIKSLPESIRQLTCLQRLQINRCPGLVQWCKSEENKMKLALIKEIILDDKRFLVIRRREPKLKNKGAPMRTMEDLENTTRDAVGIDTNHPTRLLSRESGLLKEKYDESKYEREASKQQREVLKLSRDFESLTTKDEKCGSSEAGHAAHPLDLPAQQLSLGSWIGSTTMPGTSRIQRRYKPAAELIHRKGGTARPCRGALQATPQMPPVAGPSAAVTGVCRSPRVAHLTSPAVTSWPSSTTPYVISLQCPALPPTTPGSMYTFTATARPHLPLPSTSRTNNENEAVDEREVLELSRDFESLTAKDEKSGASEAGHDASALEDLPEQQFSPGSWIGSTTTPGTSRKIWLGDCILFFDEQAGCLAASREQKLENKCGFSKAQDDDSKYEREASKQWGKDLKLSRDFESSTIKGEKSGASEADHDANTLQDLPAQQFSLGSWIGSTTAMNQQINSEATQACSRADPSQRR